MMSNYGYKKKSVPVIFEPPCNLCKYVCMYVRGIYKFIINCTEQGYFAILHCVDG